MVNFVSLVPCKELIILPVELLKKKQQLNKKEVEIYYRFKESSTNNMFLRKKIIYVDAAPNRWEKIIDKEGKKEKGKEGFRYAIVDQQGKLLETGINPDLKEQSEGEALGILKAIEWAVRNKLNQVKIFNDDKFIIDGAKIGHPQANKYLATATEQAKVNNLKVELVWIPGKENLADWESKAIRIIPTDFVSCEDWKNNNFPKGVSKSKNKYLISE